ncbi:MAG: flagellar hook-basal body complex protein [Bacillota bacterium]
MYALLGIGRTALCAQQVRLDVAAHNIANVNTTAFKAGRPCFADLVYGRLAPDVVPLAPAAGEAQVGTGAAVAATLRDPAQGALLATGRALDLAIEGEGFFGVTTPGGETLYTRDGTFYLDAAGRLVNAAGYPVLPEVAVAEGGEVTVAPDGAVTVVNPDGSMEEAGRLALFTFANPDGLEARGGNLFAATGASGEAREAAPGENGAGSIQSGRLEAANVDLAAEMTGLILAQRAYQAAARTIQAADEMWGEANDLGPR